MVTDKLRLEGSKLQGGLLRARLERKTTNLEVCTAKPRQTTLES